MADYSSDVASDAAESDLYAATPQSPDVLQTPSTPGKRRREDISTGFTGKRRRPNKLHYPPLTMTPGLWQRIFSFLPPNDLGRLLRVNKDFRKCLKISTSDALAEVEHNQLDIGPSNHVWTSSRHIYFPGAPEPPHECTELDLWKLIFDHRCAKCGTFRDDTDDPPPPSVPPPIVWAWAKRLCVECLLDGSVEEDLLPQTGGAWARDYLPKALVYHKRILPHQYMHHVDHDFDYEEVKSLFWQDTINEFNSRREQADASDASDARQVLETDLCIFKEARTLTANRLELFEHMGGFVEGLERIRESAAPCLVDSEMTSGPEPFHSLQPERDQPNDQRSGHVEDPRLAEKAAETLTWEIAQRAIRYRLKTYAEIHIGASWDKGNKVTGLNISDFACHILAKCRENWERDLIKWGTLGGRPDEVSAAMTSLAVPQGDLTLDAMKYVYLSKIKPFADLHGSHLFICPRCEFSRRPLRTYPFEACIQHFASKHTRDFGVGPSGVTWRKALWPKKLPLAPDQSRKTGVKKPRGHKEGLSVHASSDSGSHPLPPQPPVAVVPHKVPQPPSQPPAQPPHQPPPHQPPRQPPHQPPHQPTHQPPHQPSHQLFPQSIPQPVSGGLPINGQSQILPHHSTHPNSHAPGGYRPFAAPCSASTAYPQSPVSNYGPFSRPSTGTPGAYTSWYAGPPPLPQTFSPPVPRSSPYHPPPYPPPPYQHGPTYPAGVQQPPQYPAPFYQQGSPYPYPTSPAYPMPSAWPSPAISQQMQPPQGGTLYSTQYEKLAETAREVFNLFNSIPTILPSVSIYCSIRHSASRFSELWKNDIQFILFLDCVCNHRSLVGMKNAQRLACKACELESESLLLYDTFQELLMHFKNVHVDAARSTKNPPADWKENLIVLPTKLFMRQRLDELVGKDNEKAREIFLRYLGEKIQDTPEPENVYDPRHPQLQHEVDERGRQGVVMHEPVRTYELTVDASFDKHVQRSRTSSGHASNDQAQYSREMEDEDGSRWKLIPRDQYRDEDHEEPLHRDGRRPEPPKRRRHSRSHQRHPKIKQEPLDDDDRYPVKEHRILGAARRR